LILLKKDIFKNLQESCGKQEDTSMAEFLGVSRSTVWRIRTGKMQPGPDFIAAVLNKFPEKRFEDVFFCQNNCDVATGMEM
jgi:DNA-binding XRE family transcriptional regulator